MNDERKEFLIHMYDQMFNDINRHIVVIWQSISVIVGAFAILALVEKEIIPLDIAISILIILVAWLFSHLYDASYWYNRNLIIIANIERQFLKESDLKDIQCYFGKHRKGNKMIGHLSIQFGLGVLLLFIIIYYHFTERVLPGLDEPFSNFEPIRCIPYIILVLSLLRVRKIKIDRKESYEVFLADSPGIEINTEGIEYRKGHAQVEDDEKWYKIIYRYFI